MPRITKVYTRTGDDGSTGLVGGRRVAKDDPRVEAYGGADELNSQLGAALASGLDSALVEPLRRIQNDLFHLGAELAVPTEDEEQLPVPRIEGRHVRALEELIDALAEDLPPLENFVLPGGSAGAAQLHLARSVCRRTERALVRLTRDQEVSPDALRYLNRLSDALFVMARYENRRRGVSEPLWDSRA